MRKYVTRSVLLTAFLLGIIHVFGQARTNYQPPRFTDPLRSKRIQEACAQLVPIANEYAQKNHFPGMVFGIVADGRLIFFSSYGSTDLQQKIAVDGKSEFRIASMTKSFTAMSILKLRDEGKLKLDDPVYLYIPEMKGQYLTSDGTEVTIRNLLSHAAGFPEDNPWGDRQLADTDDELVALIKKHISFSNDPGLAYEYSNLGFATLGYIIKKVSGKTYAQYITDNILKPLGMTHTYFEYSKVPANELAHGYRWLNEQWVEQPMLHDGIYGAMGGMITSMEDFGKYVAFHLSAWPPRNDKETGPIKRSSVREMQHPWNVPVLNTQYRYGARGCPIVSSYAYGLGWVKDCDGKVFVGHSGGLPGFGSQWRIMPDYGIGIISFANLTYANTGTLNAVLLDTLVKIAQLQPRQLPPSAILNERKEQLVRLLPDWNNAEKSNIFAVNFWMDYFPDSLRKEAQTIFEHAGKIKKVKELVAENQLRGSFVMEGEKKNIVVSFTLTPENPALIQAFAIREE